jgi:DNA-binding CsgD family transcriptional regulator
MATKEQTDKLLKSLKRIESKLDVLVRLQKATMPKQKATPAENEILKLCNKKHTIQDMVTKTGKSEGNVKFLLAQLRKKVLIKSIRIKV